MPIFPSSINITRDARIGFEKARINEEIASAKDKKAWLFLTADYCNLGDHAIAKATKAFFKNHYGLILIEVPMRTMHELLPFVKERVSSEDILFITGGGFIGSIWFDGELELREIVEMFPNNKIIVLPQSMCWEEGSEVEKQKSITLYQNHGDMIFCARDKATFKEMKKDYHFAEIKLLPDLVMAEQYALFSDPVLKREGTLLVIRQDKESAMSEEDKEKVRQWAAEIKSPVIEIENHSENYKDVLFWERDEELKKLFKLYASAELVITDRLHGMIFSALSGTPCVAIDSATHKVKNTHKWIKDVKNIAVVKNVKQLPRKTKKVLKVGPLSWRVRQEDFKRYFDIILNKKD